VSCARRRPYRERGYADTCKVRRSPATPDVMKIRRLDSTDELLTNKSHQWAELGGRSGTAVHVQGFEVPSRMLLLGFTEEKHSKARPTQKR